MNCIYTYTHNKILSHVLHTSLLLNIDHKYENFLTRLPAADNKSAPECIHTCTNVHTCINGVHVRTLPSELESWSFLQRLGYNRYNVSISLGFFLSPSHFYKEIRTKFNNMGQKTIKVKKRLTVYLNYVNLHTVYMYMYM